MPSIFKGGMTTDKRIRESIKENTLIKKKKKSRKHIQTIYVDDVSSVFATKEFVKTARSGGTLQFKTVDQKHELILKSFVSARKIQRQPRQPGIRGVEKSSVPAEEVWKERNRLRALEAHRRRRMNGLWRNRVEGTPDCVEVRDIVREFLEGICLDVPPLNSPGQEENNEGLSNILPENPAGIHIRTLVNINTLPTEKFMAEVSGASSGSE